MHVGVSAASQPNASNGTSAQLLSLVMSGQHGCAASLLCGADRLRSAGADRLAGADALLRQTWYMSSMCAPQRSPMNISGA